MNQRRLSNNRLERTRFARRSACPLGNFIEDYWRMTDSYATAKAAYRELRSTIGPWAKANDYRRWAGTQAGWQKPVDAEQRLLFKFEGYSLVNPDTGNSYRGLVQLEPLGSHGSTILRQSDFSCCLVQAELDELARIQGAINRRRPPLPSYLKKDAVADSLLGHSLRALYDPAPQYREGHMISFRYHGLQPSGRTRVLCVHCRRAAASARTVPARTRCEAGC